jgi:hypothetical protein
MAATIHDLEPLGYTIAIAQGSAQVEQDALQAARGHADPAVLQEQAGRTTSETVRALGDAGKLPRNPEEREKLYIEIGEAAYQMLAKAAQGRVALHERALEIAQQMPDVWRVEQVVDGQTVASMLVACKPDGTGWDDGAHEILDALADKKTFAARAKQARANAA